MTPHKLPMNLVESLKRILNSAPKCDAKEVSMAQAVHLLSPDIRRMQSKGYAMDAIAKILTDNGATINGATLKCYLKRRRSSVGKNRSRETADGRTAEGSRAGDTAASGAGSGGGSKPAQARAAIEDSAGGRAKSKELQPREAGRQPGVAPRVEATVAATPPSTRAIPAPARSAQGSSLGSSLGSSAGSGGGSKPAQAAPGMNPSAGERAESREGAAQEDAWQPVSAPRADFAARAGERSARSVPAPGAAVRPPMFVPEEDTDDL